MEERKNNLLCVHCLQPLIYIKFSQHYLIVCDNYHCILFREQGQGIVPRNDDEPQEKPKRLPLTLALRPNRDEYNREGVENYRFARSLDVPSVMARDLRHKSKKEIERVAKELVRVPKRKRYRSVLGYERINNVATYFVKE